MDTANLTYWTLAFADLVCVLLFAIAGIARIRRGDVLGHRTQMLRAAGLVGLFLGSYPVKLMILGRERLAEWEPIHVTILRTHESFILLMVLAAALAFWNARVLRLWDARDGSASPLSRASVPGRLRLHRRCGRLAVFAAAGALVTSAVVLLGMYRLYDVGGAIQ
jgi:uncharacterized membrane protein YozB (DUF420 family)